MIQSFTLEKEIRVILEPVAHTQVVSIGFWQLHGSRDESESERGFTHFLEHMLFKGTQRRTAYQITQQIERVGGYLNAFTEKELTCFYCTLPAEHISLAIDILSDMFTGSLLDAEEIEKEKLVIFNEINSIEDSPEEKGHELFLAQMWDGHPLSRRITGESNQVREITRDRLIDFYRERFGLSNTVITAAGKIQPAAMIEHLQKVLSKASPPSFHTQRKSPRLRRSWQIQADKFEQVHLFTGLCYTPNDRIEDYFQELVFSTLFGESISSRLFQRLREKEGLCYAVSAFRSYYSDVALWTIYANAVPGFVPKLLDGLEEELSRLSRDPPRQQEVADAKSQLKGNFILAKEDMEKRMRRLLRQYTLTGQVMEHQESLGLLQQVTREEVAAVIERLVKADSFSLLAYGNRRLKNLNRTGFNF